jgi:hypothetical protein
MFVHNLVGEVAKWLEQGDQLVVGGDINDDVRSCLCSQRLQEIGLVEILTYMHGTNGTPPYNRGSTPIDGIYVTPTLRKYGAVMTSLYGITYFCG